MKIALMLSAVAIATLSACSSSPRVPDYECPLNDVAGAKCASVEQAYEAASSMKTDSSLTRVQSVFDRRVQQPPAPEKPFFRGELSGYPEPGQKGMPVYQQPRVMRPWIAPYVDADGNLRSGEYTYFTTPGRWNYGDLRKPGAASGIFEPSKPDQLGFNPVEPTTGKTPPRPAEPGRAGASTSAPSPTAAAAAGRTSADSKGSITQPYQRLPN